MDSIRIRKLLQSSHRIWSNYIETILYGAMSQINNSFFLFGWKHKTINIHTPWPKLPYTPTNLIIHQDGAPSQYSSWRSFPT